MDLRQYLDSTYLKTAEQDGLSVSQHHQKVTDTILEAIACGFKVVMIRPEFVALARIMVDEAVSKVSVGTVIDFPEGRSSVEHKLAQAEKAISDGADELDFVVNYEAFKQGDMALVKNEILLGTSFGLKHHKTVKWIIETAALDDLEIARLSALVKNVVFSNFKEDQYGSVFVKSSTGFYKTQDGSPNGATVKSIVIMLENACPLPVKASGGVKTFAEAEQMIKLGVKRIGTSAAKAIIEGGKSATDY